MREYAELGKFMKEARLKADTTQAELAKKLSIHSQFVSNWERGVCAPPSHAFNKLITMLKIDRHALVEVMVEDSRKAIEAKIYKKKRKSG